MGRPRIEMNFTPENALMRMTPGLIYSATHISRRFRVPTTTVRPVLMALVMEGKLERARMDDKAMGFRLPKIDDGPVWSLAEKSTSIATPPMHVRLDGELTGYDAEFRRRAELCMMVRTR